MSQEMLRRPTPPAPDEPAGRRRTAGWPAEAERFANRTEAGRSLGVVLRAALAEHRSRTGYRGPAGTDRPLVLGLPRGGVVVAREIAAALDAELDIIVARKVGLPWKPEYKVGAVSAGGPVVFDHAALAGAGTAVSAMAGSVRGHRVKLHDRQIRYRGERPTPPIAARTVVIADDGMTPGVVARAAAQAVQAGGPARLIYAAPVCAAEHADLISADVDAVVHLYSPRVFHALGLWYRDFSPVTDDDVAAVLAITWGANSPAWGTKSTAPVG